MIMKYEPDVAELEDMARLRYVIRLRVNRKNTPGYRDDQRVCQHSRLTIFYSSRTMTAYSCKACQIEVIVRDGSAGRIASVFRVRTPI